MLNLKYYINIAMRKTIVDYIDIVIGEGFAELLCLYCHEEGNCFVS